MSSRARNTRSVSGSASRSKDGKGRGRKAVREPGMALISAPGDRAEDIARCIVEQKLAACAQVTSAVTSLYWWKGKMEREPERLILFKTERQRIDGIRELLKKIHPYEIPELIFFPITAGSADYLAWLSSVMDEGTPPGAH